MKLEKFELFIVTTDQSGRFQQKINYVLKKNNFNFKKFKIENLEFSVSKDKDDVAHFIHRLRYVNSPCKATTSRTVSIKRLFVWIDTDKYEPSDFFKNLVALIAFLKTELDIKKTEGVFCGMAREEIFRNGLSLLPKEKNMNNRYYYDDCSYLDLNKALPKYVYKRGFSYPRYSQFNYFYPYAIKLSLPILCPDLLSFSDLAFLERTFGRSFCNNSFKDYPFKLFEMKNMLEKLKLSSVSQLQNISFEHASLEVKLFPGSIFHFYEDGSIIEEGMK